MKISDVDRKALRADARPRRMERVVLNVVGLHEHERDRAILSGLQDDHRAFLSFNPGCSDDETAANLRACSRAIFARLAEIGLRGGGAVGRA
jgi:hypothetical protein